MSHSTPVGRSEVFLNVDRPSPAPERAIIPLNNWTLPESCKVMISYMFIPNTSWFGVDMRWWAVDSWGVFGWLMTFLFWIYWLAWLKKPALIATPLRLFPLLPQTRADPRETLHLRSARAQDQWISTAGGTNPAAAAHLPRLWTHPRGLGFLVGTRAQQQVFFFLHKRCDLLFLGTMKWVLSLSFIKE